MTADQTGFRTKQWNRFVTQAPLLFSRHFWIWPLLGALAVGSVGYWVHNRVEGATRAELASRLQALLNADITALHIWFSDRAADAKSFAADVRIHAAIVDLVKLAQDPKLSGAALAESVPSQTLQLYLNPLLQAQDYLDFVVLDADRRILASPYPHLVGRIAPRSYDMFLGKALKGELSVSRPFAREATLSQRAEGPTMFVAAPVKADDGSVAAVLGLRMRPEEQFTRIFSVARIGDTGESYAFDHRGMMLTRSRFDEELKKLGLIPNVPEATAILNMRLEDPGAEVRNRQPNKATGPELPLTRSAAAALRGDSGVDVQGYRNYRGVEVVGAWAWLPEFGMAVATEVSTREAFRSLNTLRLAFLVLFLLVVLSALAILVFTLVVEHLQDSVRQSALTARRLGQYVLMQEIGRGANGMVYRARHALLRRPVAIKLLDPELTNEANAARFEREVQITSQLTHPNTVAIYDYGRTPEGLFYYAMEYLGGIDLNQLVRQFGPQPEGRVIHLLRQVCGSLAEAHQVGLIHRDIKPANIVLTRRGGICDVVKVVDFGLVKGRQNLPGDGKLAKAVVGTPHFMSPEAIQRPDAIDARSDLYSVGALGYWLLTGQTLFEAETVEELLQLQVGAFPRRPSERSKNPISSDLEKLILACLAKTPTQRPLNAAELEQALGQCQPSDGWSAADAEIWWQANLGSFELSAAASMAERTLIIAERS